MPFLKESRTTRKLCGFYHYCLYHDTLYFKQHLNGISYLNCSWNFQSPKERMNKRINQNQSINQSINQLIKQASNQSMNLYNIPQMFSFQVSIQKQNWQNTQFKANFQMLLITFTHSVITSSSLFTIIKVAVRTLIILTKNLLPGMACCTYVDALRVIFVTQGVAE